MSTRKPGRAKFTPGADQHAYSDSEADIGIRNYNYNAYLPTLSEDGKRRGGYERVNADYGITSDQEDDDAHMSGNSLDEFGEREQHNLANRLVRTGRQRKKLAARSKGGEFRQRRKKRRLYFCCVSSEIDVQKLFDYLVGAGSLLNGWKYQLHADVLHLYKPGIEDHIQPVSSMSTSQVRNRIGDNGKNGWDRDIGASAESDYMTGGVDMDDAIGDKVLEMDDLHGESSVMRLGSIGTDDEPAIRDAARKAILAVSGNPEDASRISGIGAQEVFVFDFGAAVFWGFSRGEETNLLKTIRMFVSKGFVGAHEFQSGEDDMAFVTAPDAEIISIANDVITLPDDSPAKQRMSVSFAIAQSTVLGIFESRVERKVEDYRYIPEALASSGKVLLTERQLGTMIGTIQSSYFVSI